MTEFPDILDTDLDAYVDGQLDVAGRLRVEAYLARHPQIAARVMGDLRMRTMLRMSLTTDDTGSVRLETRDAARLLSSELKNRRQWNSLRRVATIALFIAVGWLANSAIGPFRATEVNASIPPPAFVEQAVMAHQTSVLREGMPSQPEIGTFDAEDIRAATAIQMPKLPTGWLVRDVQVFPSQYGPSVEMRIVTDKDEQMSLFAVRPGFFAVNPVTETVLSDAGVAYWQTGEVAYAVISTTPETPLADEATRLQNSLY